MMKLKRIIITVGLVMALTSSCAVSTAASNDSNLPPQSEENAVGGWDEDTGYFFNVSEYNNALEESQVLPASSPIHSGEKIKDDSTGTTRFAAHGWTVWTGVYHYTRARMENRKGTIVYTDSNRIWDVSGTEAYSPWWYWSVGDESIARTYYGNS
ncbi:MAG: hypothetical protein Q4D16_23760 [Eubacteriales bacterium]|nr:hypothetical protein [Eubacteriales bacterium]